jgi:hypothetical protein
VPFDHCHHFLEWAPPLRRALSGDLPVALLDLRADSFLGEEIHSPRPEFKR